MIFTCPEGVLLIHLVLLHKQMVGINQFEAIKRLAHGWVFHLTVNKLSSRRRRFLILFKNPVCLDRRRNVFIRSAVLYLDFLLLLRKTFSPSCLMHNFLFKNSLKCILRTCLIAGLNAFDY